MIIFLIIQSVDYFSIKLFSKKCQSKFPGAHCGVFKCFILSENRKAAIFFFFHIFLSKSGFQFKRAIMIWEDCASFEKTK